VIETNCTRRATSTVSSQALTLLNSTFLSQRAAAFADRVHKEKPGGGAAHALQLAFGRPATAAEQVTLAAFLDSQAQRYTGVEARQQALTDLCHMLLSANEFAYVD
jgi:hypothetical protein